MKTMLILFCTLLLATTQVGLGQNLTNWELCEAIYREYGMRTEACDQDDAPVENETEKIEAKAPPLSDELQESHVFFTQGGIRLSDSAQKQVIDLVVLLDTGPMRRACVRLVGHSDSSGGAEINKKLSKQRADVVAAALKAKLTDGTRIKDVTGVGETQFLKDLPESSPYQRRVAILARDCS